MKSPFLKKLNFCLLNPCIILWQNISSRKFIFITFLFILITSKNYKEARRKTRFYPDLAFYYNNALGTSKIRKPRCLVTWLFQLGSETRDIILNIFVLLYEMFLHLFYTLVLCFYLDVTTSC